VETARTALEHKGTLDAKRNYAFSLEQYALLLFDNMRALAVKKYAEALEIYDEIARNSISKSDAGDVLRLSAWLGREYERQGNVEGAIREYERANSARYDEDGSCYELESDSERAKRCVSLGKLYMKCSEAEKASAVLYEAIELLGGCSENESDFCDARAAYGDVCLALGDAETAEEWYGDAIGGYSALFLKTHDAGYYFEIAKLYRRKAELYSGIKRKWWLKKAYKIAKMLTSKFPDEGEYTAFFRELSAEFGKK